MEFTAPERHLESGVDPGNEVDKSKEDNALSVAWGQTWSNAITIELPQLPSSVIGEGFYYTKAEKFNDSRTHIN